MNINITGHSIEITPALKELTLNKFKKIQRHFDNIISIHVVFNSKKLDNSVEATLHVPGEEIFAKANEADMYKALDEMISRLDRQVKKHKEKITNHHRSRNNYESQETKDEE